MSEESKSVQPKDKSERILAAIQNRQKKMNINSSDFFPTLTLSADRIILRDEILQKISGKWPWFQCMLLSYYLDDYLLKKNREEYQILKLFDPNDVNANLEPKEFIGIKAAVDDIQKAIDEMTPFDCVTATALFLEKCVSSLFSSKSEIFPNFLVDLNNLKKPSYHEIDSVFFLKEDFEVNKFLAESVRQIYPETKSDYDIKFLSNTMYYLEVKRTLIQNDNGADLIDQLTIFKRKIQDFFYQVGKKDKDQNYIFMYNNVDDACFGVLLRKTINMLKNIKPYDRFWDSLKVFWINSNKICNHQAQQSEKERKKEKDRADQEKERADAEKSRADAEKERADAAEARLKEFEKLFASNQEKK